MEPLVMLMVLRRANVSSTSSDAVTASDALLVHLANAQLIN